MHDTQAVRLVQFSGQDQRAVAQDEDDKKTIPVSFFAKFGLVIIRACQVILAVAVMNRVYAATSLSAQTAYKGEALSSSSYTVKFTFFSVLYTIVNGAYQSLIPRNSTLYSHRYLLGGLDAVCCLSWFICWFALLQYTPKAGEVCESEDCAVAIVAAVIAAASWAFSVFALVAGEGNSFFQPTNGHAFAYR